MKSKFKLLPDEVSGLRSCREAMMDIAQLAGEYQRGFQDGYKAGLQQATRVIQGEQQQLMRKVFKRLGAKASDGDWDLEAGEVTLDHPASPPQPRRNGVGPRPAVEVAAEKAQASTEASPPPAEEPATVEAAE